MASLRDIRRRISSVQNTQKITQAMQKVASAKLHRAQTALGYVLPYEERLRNMLLDLVHEGCISCEDGSLFTRHELLQTAVTDSRPVNKVSIVFIASDTGLCGAYNSNMERMLHGILKEYEALSPEHITLYPVGQKMLEVAKKTSCRVDDQLVAMMTSFTYPSAEKVAGTLIEAYLKGESDKTELVFYHFRTMASQVISRDVFLPFQALPEQVTIRMPDTELKGKQGVLLPQEYQTKVHDLGGWEGYLAEPDSEELLDTLLLRVLRYKLYRSALDAHASEHAARTIAMKAASENAEDLLRDLKLQYNKSRQQAITTEILDIVSGSAR
ncbi:MAG: ATP synthase F1 subunit gamma [Bacteroidales bacterium]|jgi:F-type H+-transporting ATPase subunit gamma